MLADNPVVPLYFGSKTEVCGANVGGFFANPIWDWEMDNYWLTKSSSSSSRQRWTWWLTSSPWSTSPLPSPPGKAPVRWSGTFRSRSGRASGSASSASPGSGKSVTAQAIMRLMPQPGRVTNGTVMFDGRPSSAPSRPPAKWRGTKIAMIIQDPLSSLNPLVRIGTQITEMLRYHRGMSRTEARGKADGTAALASASPIRGAR